MCVGGEKYAKGACGIDFLREKCYTERKKGERVAVDGKEFVLGEHEVLEDMLIDGLKIVQDTGLYRFTSDSVLLSRFARWKKGDVVADFCAGSGIVGFHFYALNKEKAPDMPVTLFEMQDALCALAEKTAAYNDFNNFAVVRGKLQDLDKGYHEKFSLILCNPPYERAGTGFDNDDYQKAVCRKEITLNLKEIARAANFALKFGGRICMLHRADRLAEVCYTLHEEHIEVKKIQFVGGRVAAKPYLVMVEGIKGGKPSCEILETLMNK